MADTWGVGAQGSSRLSMDPRKLLQLLAGEKRQREQRQAEYDKQQEQQRILEMLRPEERMDAEMFGLDYVAQKRRSDETRAYQDDIREEERGIDLKNREDRAREAQTQKDAEIKRKMDEKRELADAVMETAGAGRYQQNTPGMDQFKIRRPEEIELMRMAQNEAMRAQTQNTGNALQAHMGMQSASAKGTAAIAEDSAAYPVERYRILTPQEEKIILQAGGRIPDNFIGSQEFEQQQVRANAEKVRADIARKKMEAEKVKKDEEIATNLNEASAILREYGQEVTPEIEADIRNGLDIQKVLSHRAKVEAKNSKTLVASSKAYETSVKNRNGLKDKIDKLQAELGRRTEYSDAAGKKKTGDYKLKGEEREAKESQLKRYKNQLKEYEDITVQKRAEYLLERYDAGAITDDEREELKALMGIGDVSKKPEEYNELTGDVPHVRDDEADDGTMRTV